MASLPPGPQVVGDDLLGVLCRPRDDAGIDPDTVNVDGTATLVGEAVVTQCTYSGSKGGVATYSVTFTGSGALGPQKAQT